MKLFLSFVLLISAYNLVAKNSFSVAPTRVEIDLSKPKTESFVVHNNGDGDVRIEVEPIYFPVDSKEMDYGIPLNPALANADDLTSSVRSSPRIVTLKPGEQRIVRISVRPKDNLAPGEHRAHLLFKMLEIAETTKQVGTVGGKKVGMQMSFKLQMAVSIIGHNGTPQPQIKSECTFTDNKIKIKATNPSLWRFDGWLMAYNQTGKLLHELKLVVIRESSKNFNYDWDFLKTEKKVKLVWKINKEDKLPISEMECLIK